MEGSQDNLGYHYQYVRRHCIKGSCQVYGHTWFQRSRATRGGTVRQQTTPANRDSLLFVLAGFLPRVSSHAAELIHNSTTKPLRRRPDRTQRLLILMVGDIHPYLGPTAKYPCPVCGRDVTRRGVSYRCTRCTGWVHAKCSGLLNAAPYLRNEDRPQRPSNQHHHHPNHLQLLFHLPNKLVMTARSTFYSSTLMETDRTRSSIREKQGQTGGYTGVKIQEPHHPEIHHST